ncbi:hypothetical protein Q5P01_021322 [Channa striata]|uniref:Uncharacterized protein n=1 Tax=Channa striata TaxID=64152 RepID=A0AA88LU01_CHASR|nr:hypothetical protein Q5P01_021322 [Channa striata]
MSHMKKLAGDGIKNEPRMKKGTENSAPDPDQEAKARRQAQLEQRHLETYRNMHRLRDILYRHYAALLRDKVQAQRSLLQQRHEIPTAKSGNDTKQKQKKLAFCKLQHDDSYLTSLPKTSYYLIFDLQKQLAARGHLKTPSDYEAFHRRIKYNDRKSQLERSLQDVRKKMLENTSAADSTPLYETTEKHPCTAEERGHKDHVSRSRLLEQVSSSGDISAKMIFNGRQDTEEIEQMFPKMKVPTFATLQPEFVRNFQSTMCDLIIPETPKKSRKAEIYLRRLRQMHDLCLTNMLFSQRLLDRELDSLCWQEERGVQDLVLPGIDSKQEKRSQSSRPPLRSAKLKPRSVQTGRPSFPQPLSRMSSASQQHSDTRVLNTAPCSYKTPDPLSIEDVCQQEHVVVIDQGFKLWRNYANNTNP